MQSRVVLQTIEPAFSAEPDSPIPVLADIVNALGRNTSCTVHSGKNTLRVSNGPATVGTNPECAATVAEYDSNAGREECGSVCRMVGGEVYAVEPRKSVPGCDPEITIFRLGDGADASLRETVFDLPGRE